MDVNPYESSVASSAPEGTLGTTISRIVARVFWFLAVLPVLDGVLILAGNPFENPYFELKEFAINCVIWRVLPSLGLALWGVAAWRRSIVMGMIGSVLMLPFANA